MTAFDPESSASRALIVGYGNTLRGDDAAGPLVAEAIQALGLELVDVQVANGLRVARHVALVELAMDDFVGTQRVLETP